MNIFQSKEKMRLVVILALIGVLLLVLPSLFGGSKAPATEAPQERVFVNETAGSREGLSSIELAIEKNLREFLARVEGAGEVNVRVSLASTPQYEYAENRVINNKKTEEKDPQGGTRVLTETSENSQLVTAREEGASGEAPVVVREVRPDVRGVVVIASGASDIEVKTRLMQAVQTYFNVPSYKVAVLPSSGGAQ